MLAEEASMNFGSHALSVCICMGQPSRELPLKLVAISTRHRDRSAHSIITTHAVNETPLHVKPGAGIQTTVNIGIATYNYRTE